MPMGLRRELFAEVVTELVDGRGFVPPLSMVGVADDGCMFGVRFARDEGQLKTELSVSTWRFSSGCR